MEKLLYEVKHKCDFNNEFDVIDTILTDSGVKDVKGFLSPSVTHCHSPFLFRNINDGLEMLHNCITEGATITIKGDSDTDGFTSLSYLIQFIKSISDCPVNFLLSTEKKHGILKTDLYNFPDTKLFIVPDAGSSDVEECKYLKDKWGVSILILDHHNFSDERIHKYATVINCMDGFYPNKTLAGVGVVHKFCEAYCSKYDIPIEYANKYLDLVAIGMIADAMDMRNLETRYYTLQGLKINNNEFLNELCARYAESMKFGKTIKSVGWSISPNINAATRYGTVQEQENIIKALIGIQEDIPYQPRRKNKTDPKPEIEYHSLQKTMARVCCNIKSRQDENMRQYVKKLQAEIEKQKLQKDSVIVLDANNVLTKATVTGLAANKLMSIYKRPVIVLKDYTESEYGGSARGYGKGNIRDFRNFLLQSQLFEKCAGHENAFGIVLNKNNVQMVRDYCNQNVKLDDLVAVHEVDYEIDAPNLSAKNISSIANSYELWGNGVDEPLFAITNLIIPANEIKGYVTQGDYIGTIKFSYRGVTFTKKYCAKTDYESLTCKPKTGFGQNKQVLNLTLIVSFELDKYEDKTYPIAVIKHFYAEPTGDLITIEKKQKSNPDELIF